MEIFFTYLPGGIPWDLGWPESMGQGAVSVVEMSAIQVLAPDPERSKE